MEEKQTSEAQESEEKRDKTKEELEKESLEAKDDEKKIPSKPKEPEPVSSKTKGPTVSACLSENPCNKDTCQTGKRQEYKK